MPREILESDWKHFRKVRPMALGRFCDRVLAEVGRIAAAGGKSSHERYLEVFSLLQERDRELGNAFNNPRRSSAFYQLVSMRSLDLLAEEEFGGFSPELHAAVAALCGPEQGQDRTAEDC
jgi:hypothetical protein